MVDGMLWELLVVVAIALVMLGGPQRIHARAREVASAPPRPRPAPPPRARIVRAPRRFAAPAVAPAAPAPALAPRAVGAHPRILR